MQPSSRRVTVVGAGVAGLTTAMALAEVGWSVRIRAAQTFDTTVSSVAAAVWTMTSTEPVELTRRWALASRERFAEIAVEASSGIAPLRQRELERHDPGPSWWESTPYVRRLNPDEIPAGYAAGFEVEGFIIEPPRYLRWLSDQLDAAGVEITAGQVDRLRDVDGDLVVNCTGLGAQHLVGDETLFPIRGQVVAVSNPGITDAIADESDANRISYVYPRSTEVILGGARQAANSDTTPDPELTSRILADAAILDPRVAGSPVVDVRVGLRPGRPQVRVEADRLPDGRPLVHNYGHSGAGFILSWGCALDVVGEANKLLGTDGP